MSCSETVYGKGDYKDYYKWCSSDNNSKVHWQDFILLIIIIFFKNMLHAEYVTYIKIKM